LPQGFLEVVTPEMRGRAHEEMSTDTKETIELALESEQHTSRRQELLKQLWRINQLDQEDAEERHTRESTIGYDSTAQRALVEN
jgi:hypothetical protein